MPAGAPPRRRRQAASAPGTPSIWRAGPLLPVDFGRRLHRRAAELHGGTGAQLPAPGAPGSAYRPRLRGRLSNRVDFLQHLPAGGPAPGPLRLSAQPPAQCGQGLDPRGAGVTTAWYSRSPLWTSMAAFPWRARPALSWRCSPAPGGWWWRWLLCSPDLRGRDPPCLPGGRHCGVRPLPRRPFHPQPPR